MKRILVLGCGGAGKSTFAKELSTKLGIEIIHLDCHFWLPGWKMVEKEEWEKLTDQFIAKDEWIMDGNYSSTMDKRIERADTVIYFDFPNWRCLYNAFMRMFKVRFFKKKRSDLTEGCNERFDMEFYRWIWNYNKNNRRSNLEKLDMIRDEKQVFIVKSYKDKRKILSSIS